MLSSEPFSALVLFHSDHQNGMRPGELSSFFVSKVFYWDFRLEIISTDIDNG